MEDLRRHRRLQIPLRVEIRHPLIGTLEVAAADISDGGIFINVDECFQLDLAESVIVRTLDLGPDADETGPPLVMKVVRKTADGMGLKLEENASANLKSLSSDPNCRHSIQQYLFLTNDKLEVLFTLQGEHWRLPSRTLHTEESWQEGIERLIESIQQQTCLGQLIEIEAYQNCIAHSQKGAACMELYVSASAQGEGMGQDSEPVDASTDLGLANFCWLSSLEIPNIDTSLDPDLVEKLLNQA